MQLALFIPVIWKKGISYNALVSYFMASPEFTEICKYAGGIIPGKFGLLYRDRNLKDTAFVIQGYELCLGRASQQISGDELEYYCEPLLTKALTAQQIANDFVLSDEAQALYPNYHDFIVMLYHLYLDRDVGKDEISYYINRLPADATVIAGSFLQRILRIPTHCEKLWV